MIRTGFLKEEFFSAGCHSSLKRLCVYGTPDGNSNKIPKGSSGKKQGHQSEAILIVQSPSAVISR
jgi:hypothetical protein